MYFAAWLVHKVIHTLASRRFTSRIRLPMERWAPPLSADALFLPIVCAWWLILERQRNSILLLLNWPKTRRQTLLRMASLLTRLCLGASSCRSTPWSEESQLRCQMCFFLSDVKMSIKLRLLPPKMRLFDINKELTRSPDTKLLKRKDSVQQVQTIDVWYTTTLQ